jgi:hypothetical protein
MRALAFSIPVLQSNVRARFLSNKKSVRMFPETSGKGNHVL